MTRSRVAVFYEKFFGINGRSFAVKMQCITFAKIVLQAVARLPLIAAFITVHPRLGPAGDKIFYEQTGKILHFELLRDGLDAYLRSTKA